MDKSKITGQSTNPQAELLAKLMKEMPEIFSEGKIDSKKLKATLGEEVVTDQERYGLTWAGKAECFKKIQETTTNTLKPCRDESVDFDKTENLFIEGDNLQVLKVLQKSYYGKVKMIYIDPPYNTGNDFIYNDKFSRTKREELIANGSIDDEGNVINHDLYRQNTRDSGHFHSNWLNMMYPRLFLARNLLRQDGVIFVSIDDNEVKNLKAMMDEIFGEENFLGQIINRSNPRGSQEPYGISTEHEYVVCYSRSELGFFSITGNERDSEDEGFSFVDENGKKARLLGLRKRGGDWKRTDRPNMFYPFYINPKNNKVSLTKNGEFIEEVFPVRPDGQESRWTWGKNTAQERLAELYGKKIKRNGSEAYDVYRIDYLELENGDKKREKLKSVFEDKELNYQAARQYLKELFGSSEIFDFPKPPELIEKLMKALNEKEGIFLDFFAGSGTSAHAVMRLNAEDEGNRKWIGVQLPEKCKEDSEAAKAGFVTIADIAKERIRRAGKKIKQEKGNQLDLGNAKLDLGFKAFKLDESNFKVWNTQIENVEQLQKQLEDFIDNVTSEAVTENILYELIIKSGLELNIAIEEKKVKDGKYYRIGDGGLIICLADKLTKPLFETILKDKPEKIITLDRAFANNDQLKTNMMLEAEHAGVKEFKVI
ncbi:site-specific DNA-methyltransferase [Candidatus Peregrinibacteria bacterium CG_4_10_14_0_2_um_filter_38_24]|nr:MAG: site-specific DNA-methyltransferase [Candidatus Peregrinibacteria bacterium CG_4_10_14_0_2_um_filter_38_24]